MEQLNSDFRKDRPAVVETADGNDRPVPHLRLLERLVPVFPVHQRYQLYSLQALLDHVQRNIEMMANNPSLGVTTAQYMNSMPKEGARMAMAIIIIIPIACCYPFFQKYFISGLTVGAVKG